MEEELVKILSNTELDDKKKAEEIQKAVNALYVPATTVAEERKANKEALANKDKAFANLTAEYDTYKQTKMTEEEKKQEKIKKKDEQYNNALMRLSKSTAMNVFASAGLQEDDYKEFLEDIVSIDEEKTKSLAEKICTTITKQRSDVANKMKEDIINGTTPPPAGNAGYSQKTKKEEYQSLLNEAIKKNDMNNIVYYQRLIAEEEQKSN